MKQAQHGDTVTVRYIGTLDNGRIFDSATEENPLTFTIGAGQVFPALEREVAGMRAGETKTFVISAAQTFGPRLEANILRVERGSIPGAREPVVGEKMRIEFSGGIERVMLIAEVSETTVTLDGNHPLAGLDLTFALTLDAIERGE
jgi:peptidylprolyl isomerase